MMSMSFRGIAGALPSETSPITAICLVADPNACPHGYEILLRTQQDKGYDADLWSDALFSKRIKRYLCVSRVNQVQLGAVVLTDLALLNDRDNISAGYTGLDFTQDSREKGLQKKRLAARYEPRSNAAHAICKILITKQKRAPENFTLIGELNGLSICYQLGDVPPLEAEAPNQQSLPYSVASNAPPRPPPPNTGLPAAVGASYGQTANAESNRHSLNSRPGTASKYQKTPLCGIEFQLNSRLIGNTCSQTPPLMQIKTSAQIAAEYEYDFSLERSTISASR